MSDPAPPELPFCSVVLPAFNEARHIETCLRSLTQQTYPSERREIVVVDNGSTDETVDIARTLATRVYVLPDVNVGAVRNFGVDHSQGELIVFLDSDCQVEPDWLARGVDLLQKQRHVIGGVLRSRPKPSWIERYWLLEGPQVRPQQADLMGSCIFIRKTDFLDMKGFREDISAGEDSDLSARLKRAGYAVVMAPELAVIHLGNPASISEFVRRQIWHSENYFLQPAALFRDRTFLLVLVYLSSMLALAVSVFNGSGWMATIGFTQIAPIALSIKRIRRARYRVSGPSAAARILALDNLYLTGRVIGALKGFVHLALRSVSSSVASS